MTPAATPPMAGWERWLTLMLRFARLGVSNVQLGGLTADESDDHHDGRKIVNFESGLRTDNGKMPLSGVNPPPRRLAPQIAPGSARARLETLQVGQYGTVVCAIRLAWLLFRWSRVPYGPAGGLLTLALFVLDPNISRTASWS